MTDEQIKEEFIKNFGEEKWKEQEKLDELIQPQIELCRYLNIELIPVICENIDEDSRYYYKYNFIVLSPKMLESYEDALKSMVHEMRHQYQIQEALNPKSKENPELLNIWRREVSSIKGKLDSNNQESVNEYFSMLTELDAHAFSKWYLDKQYGIKTRFPNPDYDEIINKYIKKYFK